MKDLRSELLYLLFNIPVETQNGIKSNDDSKLQEINEYLNNYIMNTKIDG